MVASLSVILVEDNDDLRESIHDVLKAAGHSVSAHDCSESVPECAAIGLFDLMIIDVNLPGENGFTLAARIRQSHPDVGIIIMTARSESRDKREGYTAGADIYMTKPLELDELLAAVNALGRRINKSADLSPCLLLNKTHMTIGHAQGPVVALTSEEMSLLIAFSLSAGGRLEKWQIIDLLKKDEAVDPVKTMVLVIVRLRKKLESVGSAEPVIKMIRNWGYQLCVPLKVI